MNARLAAARAPNASSFRMLETELDLMRTHVIEGVVEGASAQTSGDGKPGIFFDQGDGQGHCLLLVRGAVQFGEIKADDSNLKVLQTSQRDLDLGPTLKFRLVIKGDMMELYVNDYLMNLKRVQWNGRLGFLGADKAIFKNIKVWQSN